MMAFALCAQVQAHAQAGDEALERNIKAASLFKFLGYAEWPSGAMREPDAPYVIGVVGDDVIAEQLQKIVAGRNVNGRSVTVRRLKANEALPDLHLLFIGEEERTRLRQWITLAQNRPILIVTDFEDALSLGSMINFRLVDGRVRFEIALDAAEKSNIRISSRMLPIAVAVHTGRS
jgi:hypothetical protein